MDLKERLQTLALKLQFKNTGRSFRLLLWERVQLRGQQENEDGRMDMAKHVMWGGVGLAVAVRLALTLLGAQIHLSRRVEVVTPITSPMRLAEGHWLKKLGLSPYAGLALSKPLQLTNVKKDQHTMDRLYFLKYWDPYQIKALVEVWQILRQTKSYLGSAANAQFVSSFLVFLAADLIGALLLREIGGLVETAHDHYMAILHVGPLQTEQVHSTSQDIASTGKLQEKTGRKTGLAKLALGDVAALSFLLNPFTIAVCVGGTTSPFENMLVIMALYGAIAGNVPLATFGWAISTHLSMYPAVLIIPIALLVTFGPDRPQGEVLKKRRPNEKEFNLSNLDGQKEVPKSQIYALGSPSWVGVSTILFWSTLWWLCIMGLCHLALGGHAHLLEMISETYGFILTVEDLSPNLGLFWYFFTEVFTHFRSFFIMVFHANVLFVIVPLTIRFRHRPLFLAFIMVAISSLLKSYPSVGDAALTLGLMSLCMPELNGFRFSLLILYGYLFVAILSPSMYDLWINRGTGNANFYFAMGLLYSALQSILIVESVGTVIRLDRRLKISVEKKHVETVQK